eukprot:m.154910 g.154910  ORF g.154910 m.154910 type:complete len:53 (+) comp30914_c0_seq1:686-844(+)
MFLTNINFDSLLCNVAMIINIFNKQKLFLFVSSFQFPVSTLEVWLCERTVPS